MDFPDDLRFAEESLKQAEKEFLAGNDGIAEALLVRLSTGTFSSDAKTARERMENLDEFRYVKWHRWEKKYEFSASSGRTRDILALIPPHFRLVVPTGTQKEQELQHS
ncbi:MAG: hypothetical protein ACE5H4_13330 [Candidatus Thorarchaeota archaeon]